MSSAHSEKWLVTGATGFIGGRLCEYLSLRHHIPVRALVHRANTAGAARIARLPVEVIHGDLLRRDSVEKAVKGCSVVVHLGLGVGRGISVGTRNLLRASEEAQVGRFVHVSSVAVHGLNPPPEAENEDARLKRVHNWYGDEKIKAERLARASLSRGLPVTILRPAIVFGPFGRWTTNVVKKLHQRRVVLVDGGSGICNTLFVDNLVHAMVLAARHPAAVGETFFVTDGERITWGEYYRAYANLMSFPVRFESLSSQEVLEYWRRQPGCLKASFRQLKSLVFTGKSLQQLARIPIMQLVIDRFALRVFSDFTKERVKQFLRIPQFVLSAGAPGANVPDLATLAIETTRIQHSIERIRAKLGYQPRITFPEGMARTESWLRIAGYLD